MKKRPILKYILAGGLVAIIVICVVLASRHSVGTVITSNSSKSNSAGKSTPSAELSSPNPTQVNAFNKNKYSINEANSLWVVVNKGRVLPSSYTPEVLIVPKIPLRLSSSSAEMHLQSDAAAALDVMSEAAKNQGINLMLASGYRSYANQVSTYNGFVKQSGINAADTYSARPGHSEHQTGLAADLEPASRKCELQDCFADTPEGKWLAENSYKYGFIIRYPKDKQNVTGYIYEPWHVRFIGSELSNEVTKSGLTLEQFFGLPSYTSYPAEPYQLQ